MDYIPDPPNPADDEDFYERMVKLDEQAEREADDYDTDY